MLYLFFYVRTNLSFTIILIDSSFYFCFSHVYPCFFRYSLRACFRNLEETTDFSSCGCSFSIILLIRLKTAAVIDVIIISMTTMMMMMICQLTDKTVFFFNVIILLCCFRRNNNMKIILSGKSYFTYIHLKRARVHRYTCCV